MQDSKAYQEWREMGKTARQIAADTSVPLWQKASKVPGAYQGLELSALRSKHRHRVLNALQEMNEILAPYEFTSFDDYHKMDERALRKILLLSKQLAPS